MQPMFESTILIYRYLIGGGASLGENFRNPPLADKGCASVGAVGFCWGAWVVWKLSATGKVQAGASCHPSTKVEEVLWGRSEAALAKTVRCPQLLLPAGNDPANLKEGGELVEIIRGSGLVCETFEFAEMRHGWSIRGDASDPAVARDVRAAVDKVAADKRANPRIFKIKTISSLEVKP